MLTQETSLLTASHLDASCKKCEQGNKYALTMTYIPNKCVANIWNGKVFFAAADQHTLFTTAEHDIHSPFICQEAKAP